ncbi:hypothetical protein [Aureimonas phyllosphaerae]|uniref:Uncharacterized protein n=1 Tax=Aureimonas phyllosphaerae TaxID=1166078 RepID=A0A7W6BZJ7_9HYPH|nr:hypothetical protein [Aureimonas phyllosphaerae]MBB3938083.1 hypothetical protein [Aureimonas phyllosphaerae]MBB3962090.1 hypothetical protein [Aureimonas phyllosphaerae]SFF56058.1 hypothetical protein SAMN05216566_12838 [Aureimonas phyllosphaerae]
MQKIADYQSTYAIGTSPGPDLWEGRERRFKANIELFTSQQKDAIKAQDGLSVLKFKDAILQEKAMYQAGLDQDAAHGAPEDSKERADLLASARKNAAMAAGCHDNVKEYDAQIEAREKERLNMAFVYEREYDRAREELFGDTGPVRPKGDWDEMTPDEHYLYNENVVSRDNYERPQVEPLASARYKDAMLREHAERADSVGNEGLAQTLTDMRAHDRHLYNVRMAFQNAEMSSKQGNMPEALDFMEKGRQATEAATKLEKKIEQSPHKAEARKIERQIVREDPAVAREQQKEEQAKAERIEQMRASLNRTPEEGRERGQELSR